MAVRIDGSKQVFRRDLLVMLCTVRTRPGIARLRKAIKTEDLSFVN
jgi:hypothetical protein